jgi:hypothetical protein
MIADRIQLLRHSVPIAHPVGTRNYQRRRFVRLAEAVHDVDFAMLNSVILNRVCLDLLHEDLDDASLEFGWDRRSSGRTFSRGDSKVPPAQQIRDKKGAHGCDENAPGRFS